MRQQKLYELARHSTDADARPWCLTVSFSHPHDPYVARRKYWDLYENCQALDPEIGFIPFDEQDPHSQRLYAASDYAELRHHARAGPALAARLFRQHFLYRRQGRRAALGARAHAHARRHGHPVLLGPWRHARRARPVVQDVLLRGLRARAADDRRQGHRARPDRGAGLQSRHPADAVRPRRHRHERHRAMDRRPIAAAADARRGAHRAGADGIRGRGQLCADGGDPRRTLQVRPLRDRSAAAL